MRFKYRSSQWGQILFPHPHPLPTDTQRTKSRDLVKRVIERSNSREPLALPRDTGQFPKEKQVDPFPSSSPSPRCDDE